METKHFLISKEENDYKTKEISVEKVNELIESGYRKLSDENISIIYLPDNIKNVEVNDVIINDSYEIEPNEDEVEFSEENNSVGENRNIIENLLNDKKNIYSYIFKSDDTEASRSKPYFVNTPGIYLVFCKKDSLINLKVKNLENLTYDYENVSYILCDYYPLSRGGHIYRKEMDFFAFGFDSYNKVFKTRVLSWNKFMKQNSINELFVCLIRLDNPIPIIEEIDKSLIYSPLMKRSEIVNNGFIPEHNLIVENVKIDTIRNLKNMNEENIKVYISKFENKRGLFIIRSKSENILKEICEKLNKKYQTNVAFIGLGDNKNTSDLSQAAYKQMGWGNYISSSFAKTIANYLDIDTSEKNKDIEKTRAFIFDNFDIECIIIDDNITLNDEKKKYIEKYKPCLNR